MERKLREKLPGGRFTEVKPQHSQIMKGVRGKGNRTTEARFRAALVSSGVRGWRTNVREIKGSPDFYFPEERLAVFIDGCFWHGCNTCGHIPKKNRSFWEAKIDRNRERHMETAKALRRQGVSVLRFWEHEVADSLTICISKTRQRLARSRSHLRRSDGEQRRRNEDTQ